MIRMGNEPLTYTRALLDKLQKSIAQIVFAIGIISFCVSLLFFGYSIFIHATQAHWIRLSIYSLIAGISVAVFAVYLSGKSNRELERRYSHEQVRAFLSYCIIGLRFIAAMISLVSICFLEVHDAERFLAIGMVALVVIQIGFELLKSFVFHYIDLFRLSLEEDRKTLGDDVKNLVVDYVKESISNKWKSGISKVADSFAGYVPTVELPKEAGPYETKLRKELDEAHEEFLAKKKKLGEERTASAQAEEIHRKERRRSAWKERFAPKGKKK